MAHGWHVDDQAGLSQEVLHEYVAEPVAEVPESIAARIGACRVRIVERLDEGASSRWTVKRRRAQIELAAEGVEPHDLAMELLLCVGQIVWEQTPERDRLLYLVLLSDELEEGATGEIDDDVLAVKRLMLEQPADLERMATYAAASFAATLAEYIHSLWHDVAVRRGKRHLKPETVRRRFALMEQLFPPDANQQLWGGLR